MQKSKALRHIYVREDSENSLYNPTSAARRLLPAPGGEILHSAAKNNN